MEHPPRMPPPMPHVQRAAACAAPEHQTKSRLLSIK